MLEFREVVRSIVASGAETAERFAAERELCLLLAPRIRLYGLRHLRNETAAADLVLPKARLRFVDAATNGEPKRSPARCCL